ncbi:hypothetical protein BN2537_6193 [Streptomyces venezuelae]|nr:hypothetical protein BN2537_6193 [Streptomyces venezuelae]
MTHRRRPLGELRAGKREFRAGSGERRLPEGMTEYRNSTGESRACGRETPGRGMASAVSGKQKRGRRALGAGQLQRMSATACRVTPMSASSMAARSKAT